MTKAKCLLAFHIFLPSVLNTYAQKLMKDAQTYSANFRANLLSGELFSASPVKFPNVRQPSKSSLILDYISYTVKVSELADSYTWLLIPDRAYRILQAQKLKMDFGSVLTVHIWMLSISVPDATRLMGSTPKVVLMHTPN